MDRDQLGDLASAVGQDLAKGVATQGQVPLQHLAPLERVLVPIGLLAQQPVEPVVRHPVLAAICSSTVDHQWQRGHGLRQDAHAGIDGCQAHGRIGRDAHARDTAHRYRLKKEIAPWGAITCGSFESVKEVEDSHR